MTASCGPTPGAPESTVIRAEEADLDVLSFVIAEAFGDLAPSRWLIPGQAARREIFPGYFRLHLEHALACGVVHTTPGRTAAALWLPGGAGTAWPPDGYDERLAAATSPWTGRFTAFDAALGHRHPAVPHHYLAILAVRPDRQGRGTGTALLDACHAVLDRDPDMPAYLEAAGPRSRGLYLVHGYRDHGPPIHLPDGPAMYPMMRQPRGRGPDMPAETGTAQAGPGAGALPAVLTHILAVCRARLRDRGTVEIQPGGVGRYVITACRRDRELVMMFARRRRGWVLAAAGLITDGQPQGIRYNNLPEVMRLLGDHQAGTGDRSPVRAARLPRNSAVDARKNTVLRV